ncbi:MAG TPA: alpha/beta hydrolase, partial [Coleofasciculaceae cyanobacterium]
MRKSQPSLLTPGQPKPDYPLFIFLPGTDGTGSLLKSQLSGLEQVFDVRCLALPHDDAEMGWDALAQQLADLITAEQAGGVPRSTYICGESFGACLALKLAVQCPHLFNQLILINPASSLSRMPWMRLGVQALRWLPDSLYPLSTLGLLPFLIVPNRVDRSAQQELVKAMQSLTPQTAAWRLNLLGQFNADELPLEAVKQPVLIIASHADCLLPSDTEASHLAERLPNAQVVALPESGHACLLESEVNLYHLLRSTRFIESPRLMTSDCGKANPVLSLPYGAR